MAGDRYRILATARFRDLRVRVLTISLAVHIFPFAYSHVATAYLLMITTRRSAGYRPAHRRHPVGARRSDPRGFNRARPKPRPFTRLAPARSILKATAPLSTRNEASAADLGPSVSCRTRIVATTALRYRAGAAASSPTSARTLPIPGSLTLTGSPPFIRLSNRDTADAASPNRDAGVDPHRSSLARRLYELLPTEFDRSAGRRVSRRHSL